MKRYTWSPSGIVAWVSCILLVIAAMLLAHFGPVGAW